MGSNIWNSAGKSGGIVLYSPGQLIENQLLQLHFLARIVDVDSYEIAVGVVVENDPVGNFAALGAGPLGEIDVKRIGVGMIVELHGCATRHRIARFVFDRQPVLPLLT